MKAGAEAAGRDPKSIELVYGAVTVVDHDARVAELVARRNVAMYVGVTGRLDPTYSPPEMNVVERALAAGDEEAAAAALTEDTLRRFCTYGTPRDIIAHMEKLFEAGVDVFELGTPHGVREADAIRILGEEVLPYFC